MSTVRYDRLDRIAVLTLDRPEKLNAIDDALFTDLRSALLEARRDPEVRALLLRGAGRAFSVGQDLSGVGATISSPPDPRSRPYLAEMWQAEQERRELLEVLYRFPKDTIAQVHGYCISLGLDLAMCCHTVVAAEDTIFAEPGVRLGYASANPLWTWKVGVRKARELLFTGRSFDGSEALELGLVTVLAPTDAVVARGEEVALYIARQQGIGGRDGVAVGHGHLRPDGRGLNAATMDAAGLATAWDFTSNVSALSLVQRRGFRRDEIDFFARRDAVGLRAALRERDAPYEVLGLR
ncbi:MAG: enoyl-CoA hydratase/isomerase family protein [Chloroflexi bacterium]|nr:enoyl-CoA hydratase/isomerase family protein [Chloroflexota bacterium]